MIPSLDYYVTNSARSARANLIMTILEGKFIEMSRLVKNKSKF